MVLRDDARLVPCDSHLWAMWAMQPLWSTATIEICSQYSTKIFATFKRLIGHFNHTVVTLRLLWYQSLIA